MRSLEPELFDDVCVWKCGLYGLVIAKFYHDDVKDIFKFVDKDIVETYPQWTKKPIYLIVSYSEDTFGEKYIALYDVLTRTGELN